MRGALTLDYGRALCAAGEGFTAFAGVTVIACAGVVRCWPGRAQAWSLMSEHLPQYKKSIHKAVTRYLDRCVVRRLEMTVDPTHAAAMRWAERLGFTYESTMPGYGPFGETHAMYVRLRME